MRTNFNEEVGDLGKAGVSGRVKRRRGFHVPGARSVDDADAEKKKGPTHTRPPRGDDVASESDDRCTLEFPIDGLELHTKVVWRWCEGAARACEGSRALITWRAMKFVALLRPPLPLQLLVVAS